MLSPWRGSWAHFIECIPGTLCILNKYAVTLTTKPPDGATVGNSQFFHSNGKEGFLSKYYLERSLGIAVTTHTNNHLLHHPTPDIAGPQSHQIFKSVLAQSYQKKALEFNWGIQRGVLSIFSLWIFRAFFSMELLLSCVLQIKAL